MNMNVIVYLVAGVLILPCARESQETDRMVRAPVAFNENYSSLLRTMNALSYEKTYGELCDAGVYARAEFADIKGIQLVYSVPFGPNCCIWKNNKTPLVQVSTLNVPDARNIVARTPGYIVMTRDAREIVAVSLPDMRETVVRAAGDPTAEFGPTIHALSGPDSEGRIVYIEDHFFVQNEKDRKHLLKSTKLDGRVDTEIFSRPGSAMWATSRAGHGEIGAYVAFAPSGGKVALLSRIKEKQMPRALLNVGRIEIWDVAKKALLADNTIALDEPMSWFPDGKRLAHVKLVAREKLPNLALGLTEFGKYADQLWDEVPSVYILDVETGISTFLHVGWAPVVSADGKIVLVGGWDSHMNFNWMVVDMRDRSSKPVHLPGDAAQSAIAAPSEDIVLYWGLPATGPPVKHTERPGRKFMLSLKMALIDSGGFQTVVPEIDPRSPVSFGRVLERR